MKHKCLSWIGLVVLSRSALAFQEELIPFLERSSKYVRMKKYRNTLLSHELLRLYQGSNSYNCSRLFFHNILLLIWLIGFHTWVRWDFHLHILRIPDPNPKQEIGTQTNRKKNKMSCSKLAHMVCLGGVKCARFPRIEQKTREERKSRATRAVLWNLALDRG